MYDRGDDTRKEEREKVDRLRSRETRVFEYDSGGGGSVLVR